MALGYHQVSCSLACPWEPTGGCGDLSTIVGTYVVNPTTGLVAFGPCIWTLKVGHPLVKQDPVSSQDPGQQGGWTDRQCPCVLCALCCASILSTPASVYSCFKNGKPTSHGPISGFDHLRRKSEESRWLSFSWLQVDSLACRSKCVRDGSRIKKPRCVPRVFL